MNNISKYIIVILVISLIVAIYSILFTIDYSITYKYTIDDSFANTNLVFSKESRGAELNILITLGKCLFVYSSLVVIALLLAIKKIKWLSMHYICNKLWGNPNKVSKGDDDVEYIYTVAGEKLAKKKNGSFINFYTGAIVYKGG